MRNARLIADKASIYRSSKLARFICLICNEFIQQEITMGSLLKISEAVEKILEKCQSRLLGRS